MALRDVARHAGVSLGTVSNVLTNKPGVASRTREAVYSAMTELGYQPASPATTRGAPRAAVGTLGFLVRSLPNSVTANPFYSHVLGGTEQACAEHQVNLLYATVDENTSQVEQLPPMIRDRQIQGLLVVGYFHASFFTLLQRLAIPFVMVDYYLDALEADCVLTADEHGGYLATRHLLERVQHPVPAMITGWDVISSNRNRLLGYQRALAESGLRFDERYVRALPRSSSSHHRYHDMLALLDLPEPANAVFCCNDTMALEALRALRDRGIAVPEQCALIGFDDLDMATHAVPPLTTMHVDKEELGAEGVRLLLQRIAHPQMTTRRVTLSVHLLERGTVPPRL